MKTYDEILNSMKNTYFEESGSAVEDNSQTLKLLEIVASELYGLSCYADWALKQNFVQTANGETCRASRLCKKATVKGKG